MRTHLPHVYRTVISQRSLNRISCGLFCVLLLFFNNSFSQDITHSTGSWCVGSTNEFDLGGDFTNCTVSSWHIAGDYTVEYTWSTGISVHWNTPSAGYIYATCLCPEGGRDANYGDFSVAYEVTPSVSITSSKTTSCSAGNTSIQFTATPVNGGGYPHYYWNVHGPLISHGSSNIFNRATWSNGDVVKVYMTSSASCPTTSEVVSNAITISVTPKASIPAGPKIICSTCSETIAVIAPTGPDCTYKWWLGNFIPLAGQTQSSLQVSTSGDYSVDVTKGECTSRSEVFSLLVNQLPVANAGSDVTLAVPPLDGLTLNGSGSDPGGSIISYSWSKVSGPNVTLLNANTPNLLLTDISEGTYLFQLTVTDDFGESSTDQVSVTTNYPINNHNWIKETTVQVKDKLTAEQVNNALIENGEKNVSWNYFDGLGRPMQSITVQGSPLKKDVVVPIVYDVYGRENLKYLPVTVNETTGYLKTNTDIIDATTQNYKGIASNVYTDVRPFSETQFEPSPLNRPLKQFGVGNDWKVNNKFIEHQYLTNIHIETSSLSGEKIIAWKLVDGALTRSADVTDFIETGGYYSTGQLFIKSTKDEQGNEVREYTNKEGQVILKKVQAATTITSLNSISEWAQTYYIYDDFGSLVVVLPPEAVKILMDANAQ